MTKQAYLFVHFKEKRTPDGEQVYFGVSRDGFHWELVNDGQPVLWSYYGDKGVRDHTIVRTEDGKFFILATDLSLSYGMLNQYENSWEKIGRCGSKCLSLWESDDLVHWRKQRMVKLGDEHFGCLWAPDIIRDPKDGGYLVHWSSSHDRNDYGYKGIFCAKTHDFVQFTEPRLLYEKQDSGIIDSAMYEENGRYFMFLKSEENPQRIILVESESITGPFERNNAFDQSMEPLEAGLYEAPTAVKLADGRWCLFLDYYGCDAEGQGYVPFIADSLASGRFIRSDAAFHFPYGYKHGTILAITMDEYESLKQLKKKPSEY